MKYLLEIRKYLLNAYFLPGTFHMTWETDEWDNLCF